MSRGHGKIQQAIILLIESDEDGAWSTSEICSHVFRGLNRVEKKHRVAVSRALRTMALPETWAVSYAERRGGDAVLYNRLSIESTSRMRWLTIFGANRCSYEKYVQHYSHQVDKARESVAEYRVYFEADEIGRIDILIADERKRAALVRSVGGSPEFFKSIAANIERLSKQKADLVAAAVNVSASQKLGQGNTYEVKP